MGTINGLPKGSMECFAVKVQDPQGHVTKVCMVPFYYQKKYYSSPQTTFRLCDLHCCFGSITLGLAYFGLLTAVHVIIYNMRSGDTAVL